MINTPKKWNSKIHEQETLFGTVEELSSDEKADQFFIRYTRDISPFKRYKGYFDSQAVENSRTLLEIKRQYKNFVLGEAQWSEETFVKTLDKVFKNRLPLNQYSCERECLKLSQQKNNGRSQRARRW